MNKTAIAKIKYLRVSPRKMVGVCALVRGKDILVARSILMRTPKKGARFIEKALNSAVANAKNKNMDEKRLIIKEIKADMGSAYKRHIPWSKGSPRPIKKRTTHLTIIVEEKEGGKKESKKIKNEEIKKIEKQEIKETVETKEEVKKPVKEKKAKGGVKVRVKGK
jgi:large subunit ribosomal protein L22